jgi:adenosylhomocysteinase
MSTNVTENYEVKDIALAEQGRLNLELAELRMPALMRVREEFERDKPLRGITVGMALHVTKETGILVRTLRAGGADVAITGCNPLSTQDDVAACLATEGVAVYAYKGETREDYYRYINKVIEAKPHVTIDDGCDLVSEIHQKHTQLIPDIIAGCEETTTGIIRLRAMVRDGALKYPMIAVNDNQTKHLLDNYYGTGQSTWDGILRASNVLVAGKNVVVAGYGSCGKGVCLRARGLGAHVTVTEVNHFRALQARLDGYQVMPMAEAARFGEIFVTVTGNKNVITVDHMRRMPEGAVLANSGHFDNEIDVKSLLKYAGDPVRVRPWFDRYTVDGKKLFLCGEGRLTNLACAEGHPSEVMATSFCGQALAVAYAVEHRGKLPAEVITLPEEIDDRIAQLQLEAMGVTIDTLTPEQEEYLNSWQEGT